MFLVFRPSRCSILARTSKSRAKPVNRHGWRGVVLQQVLLGEEASPRDRPGDRRVPGQRRAVPRVRGALGGPVGLGIITSLPLANTPSDQEPHVGHGGAEKLRMEIRKCKSLTDKPFGVNVTKLPMIAPGNLFGDIVQVVSKYTHICTHICIYTAS